MEIMDLFCDIQEHLVKDKSPSVYLNNLKDRGELDKAPFSWLKDLEMVQQSEKHHPEGNVWIHTMMVVDEGARYINEVDDKEAFMWALLLHDLGKLTTTKLRKGRWTSYDHDKVGEDKGIEFLKCFNLEEDFIERVVKLVRYHMHLLFIVNNLPFGDIEGMKREAPIKDLSYVFLSDRLGRGGIGEEEENKIKSDVDRFRKDFL